MDNKNLFMLTDFYKITMANGYLKTSIEDEIAYFDMFFRRIPDNGGFVLLAGLEQVVEYLNNLNFTEEDIAYLESKKCFSQRFLEYLRDFSFSCDVWAIPEGTPVFPGEPLVTVRGPLMQAQFVETMILLIVNHQSLVATKANRIVRAAQERPVMEFGTRRAHGASAAVMGARAAYIGGCAGTACTISDRDYSIPTLGKGGPYFSLSHAEGLAVVAIFPDREVGVDIERVRPFPAMADIAEQFFSSGERAWIAGGVPPESRFFRCWVLREAFVKALGEGLSFPLDRFCIRPPDDRGGDGVSLILKDGGSPDVDLTEWHPAEGFAGALAVRRQPFVGQDQGLS